MAGQTERRLTIALAVDSGGVQKGVRDGTAQLQSFAAAAGRVNSQLLQEYNAAATKHNAYMAASNISGPGMTKPMFNPAFGNMNYPGALSEYEQARQNRVGAMAEQAQRLREMYRERELDSQRNDYERQYMQQNAHFDKMREHFKDNPEALGVIHQEQISARKSLLKEYLAEQNATKNAAAMEYNQKLTDLEERHFRATHSMRDVELRELLQRKEMALAAFRGQKQMEAQIEKTYAAERAQITKRYDEEGGGGGKFDAFGGKRIFKQEAKYAATHLAMVHGGEVGLGVATLASMSGAAAAIVAPLIVAGTLYTKLREGIDSAKKAQQEYNDSIEEMDKKYARFAQSQLKGNQTSGFYFNLISENEDAMKKDAERIAKGYSAGEAILKHFYKHSSGIDVATETDAATSDALRRMAQNSDFREEATKQLDKVRADNKRLAAYSLGEAGIAGMRPGADRATAELQLKHARERETFEAAYKERMEGLQHGGAETAYERYKEEKLHKYLAGVMELRQKQELKNVETERQRQFDDTLLSMRQQYDVTVKTKTETDIQVEQAIKRLGLEKDIAKQKLLAAEYQKIAQAKEQQALDDRADAIRDEIAVRNRLMKPEDAEMARYRAAHPEAFEESVESMRQLLAENRLDTFATTVKEAIQMPEQVLLRAKQEADEAMLAGNLTQFQRDKYLAGVMNRLMPRAELGRFETGEARWQSIQRELLQKDQTPVLTEKAIRGMEDMGRVLGLLNSGILLKAS